MFTGTMRSNRRELPQNLPEKLKLAKLFETIAAKSDACILTAYKCKKNKSVTLLSTLHRSIEYAGDKRKPSTISDYNNTKYGVDVVDQMTRMYTCKVALRRWPVQIKLQTYTIQVLTITMYCMHMYMSDYISGFLQSSGSSCYQCICTIFKCDRFRNIS